MKTHQKFVNKGSLALFYHYAAHGYHCHGPTCVYRYSVYGYPSKMHILLE